MRRSLTDLERRVRPYPVALAQELARTKPGESRLALLNRLYLDMLPADKLRVQAELHAIRSARRGKSQAAIIEGTAWAIEVLP